MVHHNDILFMPFGCGSKISSTGCYEGGCDKILWTDIYSIHIVPKLLSSLGSCEKGVMGNWFEA